MELGGYRMCISCRDFGHTEMEFWKRWAQGGNGTSFPRPYVRPGGLWGFGDASLGRFSSKLEEIAVVNLLTSCWLKRNFKIDKTGVP